VLTCHIKNPGDGLRHYGYQKEKKFYNGVTMEDIHNPQPGKDPNVNGIQGTFCPIPFFFALVDSADLIDLEFLA
jgi:hypothetical protein